MKVSPEIAALKPYVPGKPIEETQREFGLKDVIKLASNENPLGVSPRVAEALKLALTDLHRYPDAGAVQLIQAGSQAWSVPAENLAVGNGSNELIDLLIRIYCEPGDAILTFQHAFVAYPVCAQAARARVIEVPTGPDFQMSLSTLAEKLRKDRGTQKIRLVCLANPNNPTGVLIPWSEISVFLKEFGNDPDLLIVFDEAYVEYVTSKDYRPMIQEFRHWNSVVVLRTLSKAYGLAGLRVGFLAGPLSVVDLVNRVRNPFNVNSLAQVAAIAALQDPEFVQRGVELNTKERAWVAGQLQSMGLKVIESQANFVLFDSKKSVKALNQRLLSRGLILRPVLNYGLDGFVRMSIGTHEENAKALQILGEVLNEGVAANGDGVR